MTQLAIVAESVAEPGQSTRWNVLPDARAIEETLGAVNSRGIHAELVEDGTKALERVKSLIPAGAQLMTGGSKTLEAIGFTDLLKSDSHGWKNVKAEILAEKDPAKQMELRSRAVFSDYFVGSIQAVAKTGEVVIASASGSQLAAYAYGARHIVWVVGTQKIVSTLEDGLKRVREHALPLEDRRMRSMGYPGSFLGKILIYERSVPSVKANLILVNERLGF